MAELVFELGRHSHRRRTSMSDLRATILELSKPNPKTLIVAINYAIKPEPEIMPYVPEHLKYMAEHEDRVFLSGPFIKPERLVNAGLIIFNSDREEDALYLHRFCDCCAATAVQNSG